MTYVMSDLHGEYEKYQQMLQRIDFSEDDTLIIAGDLCDRGENSVKLYLDVMARRNVFVIKGNHEEMAEEYLPCLLDVYDENPVDLRKLLTQKDLWYWAENGGDATIRSILPEHESTKRRILQFIQSLPYYKEVDVNGNHYIIIHGGPGKYHPGMQIDDVQYHDLLWSRPDYDGRYFGDENTYLIVGHVPTFLMRPVQAPATIYRGRGNVIAIDCGAVFSAIFGRLGCLCLDTNEEFYV